MSATYYNLSNVSGALKEYYDGQQLRFMTLKGTALLGMLPKDPTFVGKSKPYPIVTSGSGGRSAGFSVAQGNQTGVSIPEFMVTTASDYALFTIDGKTMMQAAGDKGAFMASSKIAIDTALNDIKLSISSALFRSGTGSIGQISGTPSVSGSGPYNLVITLTNPIDSTQFSVNQYLVASATDGGTASSDVGQVIAVVRDYVTSTLTVQFASSPSGTWAANAYLSVQGDLNAKLKGLAGWIPAAAPTSGDNWFGVDRSQDATRLAGVRYDGSQQPIEEALIDLANAIAIQGGDPRHCIVNPYSFAALQKSLGAKVQFVDVQAQEDARIGFRGVMLDGPNGPINVFPDRNCQPKTAWMLQMDTWELLSTGDVPHFAQYGDDGNQILRVSSADAGEGRVRAYLQLACNAPGYNGRGALGA